MKLYDIIHTEDDGALRELVEFAAQRKQLSYLGVNSLAELKKALREHDAKCYVVDGKFPEDKGHPLEFNAPLAIASIRAKYPDAKIILYSGNEKGNIQAQDLHVHHAGKYEVLPNALIQTIEELI